MAMNPLEENILSAIKFDKHAADFADYSDLDWRLERSRDCMRDEVLDSLPCDPFGMGLGSTLTTFSGWLEGMGNELDLNSLTFSTSEQVEVAKGDDCFLAEVNLFWNGSVKSCSQAEDSNFEEASILSGDQFLAGLREDGLILGSTLEEPICAKSSANGDISSDIDIDMCAEVEEGCPPHDGLLFALGYLGLEDLLCVEMVCKSLRDAVRNDPLLWRRICINYPLSLRINDDALLELTSRARGTLQCLNLVECLRITDIGLGQVLKKNPQITKLSVPGCLGISIEGLLANLKTLRSNGNLEIKVLRISGIDGVTDEMFEELKSLLGADRHRSFITHKPRFFGGGPLYLSCEDDRVIDIEKCPTCDRYRQVYDCTSQSCSTATQSCRACTFCIARCIHCGRCIRELDYMETFCLDLLCLDCWRQLLNGHNSEETSGDIHSSDYIIVHSWEGYHVYLHG